MLEEILASGIRELGLEPQENSIPRFRMYFEELEAQNRVMNLTAITGEEDVSRLHFLDCIALAGFAEFRGKSVADIGSGAGFPGLPLKIIEPSVALFLLDSRERRVEFLKTLCEKLGFSDVRCIHGRAEDVPPLLRESFDIVLSRAVARLNVLSELCMPYVSPGGLFIAMKGPDCGDEAAEAQNAISKLGGEIKELRTYNIPGSGIRHSAVIIQKIDKTPEKYPRRYSKIQKEPL